MDIRSALEKEHSKPQTLAIVAFIGSDPQRFAELMKIFLGDSYRLTQRASWAVNYCAENHPNLVDPYFTKLLKLLGDKTAHNAVRRNIVRMLQFITIPKRHAGKVFDISTELATDPHEPIAVRAFAMTVAANIAKDEPSLMDELRMMIEPFYKDGSAGFKARARKVLGVEFKNNDRS